MNKLLLFGSVIAFAVSVYAAEVPDITIPELKAAIAAGKVVVIDADGTESYQKGHIPGAINYETSKGKLATLLPKDKAALVVAYCGGPKCKAYQKAAAAAKELGYTNVKHLSAGISGWTKAGEPTAKGS